SSGLAPAEGTSQSETRVNSWRAPAARISAAARGSFLTPTMRELEARISFSSAAPVGTTAGGSTATSARALPLEREEARGPDLAEPVPTSASTSTIPPTSGAFHLSGEHIATTPPPRQGQHDRGAPGRAPPFAEDGCNTARLQPTIVLHIAVAGSTVKLN